MTKEYIVIAVEGYIPTQYSKRNWVESILNEMSGKGWSFMRIDSEFMYFCRKRKRGMMIK